MPDCIDSLRVVVKRCFPTDARIVTVSKETDLIFAISWRVKSDPDRPLKRSKIIRLNIEEEAVAQYENRSAIARQTFEARLERSLHEHLVHFDADHHAPAHQVPPVVDWLVNADNDRRIY